MSKEELESLSVDDELKEMDEEELNERLEETSGERNDLNQDLQPYNDDIEEGNYDGDSVEIITHIGECDSEINEVLQVMKAKGYEIPEGFQEAADEL